MRSHNSKKCPLFSILIPERRVHFSVVRRESQHSRPASRKPDLTWPSRGTQESVPSLQRPLMSQCTQTHLTALH